MLDSWFQNVYLFVVDILGRKEIVYSSIQIVIYNFSTNCFFLEAMDEWIQNSPIFISCQKSVVLITECDIWIILHYLNKT